MKSKEKAKDALPLKGISKGKTSSKNTQQAPKQTAAMTGDISDLEDVLGTRKERRECAVGVRVTREMKEILENLSTKTRLSESEIVYRILQKNLNLEA